MNDEKSRSHAFRVPTNAKLIAVSFALPCPPWSGNISQCLNGYGTGAAKFFATLLPPWRIATGAALLMALGLCIEPRLALPCRISTARFCCGEGAEGGCGRILTRERDEEGSNGGEFAGSVLEGWGMVGWVRTTLSHADEPGDEPSM